ncbi:MAG TPA: UTP--glucose-1-phosphate uridylyltransferase [bacterium]|nr:UTP--glucose-1-phosphate uridylyltransferase [bacterium]
MKIRKAIIPVAGLGTRFLPYTKAVPKEMLPIIDVPAIHYIIEEALSSGIESILFITSEGKQSIEEYFSRNHDLEKYLKAGGNSEALAALKKVPYNFKRHSVIQAEARGLGHAVLHAEDYAGGEPFAVFLPDDLIFHKKPATKQMTEAYDKYKMPVIAVERVARNMVSSYGIIRPVRVAERVYNVTGIREKPPVKEAFSNLGIVGRYILPPSIFGYLKKTKPGAKGEIQLTDALAKLMKEEGLFAYEFEGTRCDTGNKYDYIVTVMRYAALQKGIKGKLKKEAKKIFGIK